MDEKYAQLMGKRRMVERQSSQGEREVDEDEDCGSDRKKQKVLSDRKLSVHTVPNMNPPDRTMWIIMFEGDQKIQHED
jgi:hypothetical protein